MVQILDLMIYVSLTTIPRRLKNLNKSIESILKQTQKPDKIFINIPKHSKTWRKHCQNIINILPGV